MDRPPRRARWILCLIAGSVLLIAADGGAGRAPAGEGCVDLARAPGSRWQVAVEEGVAWLRTPCGDRFFSLGVNVVDGGSTFTDRPGYRPQRHYPDPAGYTDAARRRLTAWGFNTLGAWSFPAHLFGLPITPDLSLGGHAKFHWLDPFHPDMGRVMTVWAGHLTGPYRNSPFRIGYFSDNEVGWWNGPLYTHYIRQPASNHTKRRLVAFLREHYGDDWRAFAADFETAGITSFETLLTTEGYLPRLRVGSNGIQAVRRWTGVIAGHYYRLVHDAVRTADPDALILGDRLPIYYDPVALRAMAPYVDVVSVNYNVDSPDGWIARYFFDGLRQLTGKPILVSEWFFAAHDNRSGNRNNGHLMTVATQEERARGAAAAARNFARLPDVTGLHWFQFYDYPTGGRADGEDYNFGLIDIHDQPYQRLVSALQRAHAELMALHQRARRPPTWMTDRLPYARIDATDGHLADWPKPEALVLPMLTPHDEIVFGDVYASWSERGLALGLIAMDYYDPELLAHDGELPLQEAFTLQLGVDGGPGPRRFVVGFRPQPGGPRDPYWMRPDLCRVTPAGCMPVDGAELRSFTGAPRIAAEVLLPWEAIGIEVGEHTALRLDIAVTAFHRSRWMSWSGLEPGEAMGRPDAWRPVRLGPQR